ncbi:MAG: alpha/beta fold hydrolase [Roseiflexaceae bacterium]|nr:alpha/beta fold hydrolase [Roseiflexaceae bacterium]
MQRFTWLFAILILSLATPLLAQAQPALVSNSAMGDRDADALQHTIVWVPCPENAAVECAALTLPVDYAKPRATFEMAVVRAKALNPAARIGVLFVHPGGHASGVDFVRNGVSDPSFNRVRQRFDIVSLDPRGAGRTRPLACGFDLPPLAGPQTDATLQAFYDDRARLVAAQCLDEDRDFVLSISGNNFARDIEQFRRALGERQLSFLMISNSGPVGAVYASRYPKRVRAMLLDSPVGPDFRDYNIERPAEQAAAQDLALGRVDQICARTPSCPLHTTGVVAAFDTVRERLLAQPFTLPDGSLFTAARFSSAIAFALSNESQWPLVVVALTNALAENYALFAQVPGFPTLGDGFTARFCNDYGTRRAAADYQQVVEALGTTYERFTSAPALASSVSSCMAWPAADTPLIRNVQRKLKTPILLIGGEFDTDAPFSWTKRMATALGMDDTVVRYTGGGHVLAQRDDLPCITRIIDAYLFDLTLPAPGTVCPAAPFGAP